MSCQQNNNEIPHGYSRTESLFNSMQADSMDGQGPQHNDWVHYRLPNLAGDDLVECERTPVASGQQTTQTWDFITCPHCVTSLAQDWASFAEFAPPLDPAVYHSDLDDQQVDEDEAALEKKPENRYAEDGLAAD